MSFNYSVRVNLIKNPQGKTKAFANIIVGDIMEVCGFKIVEGSRGLFVSAPQTKGEKDGGTVWYDNVRFLDFDREAKKRGTFNEEVFAVILEEYNKVAGTNRRGAAAAAQAASTDTQNRLW